MTYSVIFSSQTGNTRMLAEAIRDSLPREDLLYFGAPDEQALAADRLYVGFWTDRGICDKQTGDFLSTIRDREVFLFGTAGFGGVPSYFEKILASSSALLDRSVSVVGSFMCQGKMPASVRERYVRMKKSPIHVPNVDRLIENFDAALSHPDRDDLHRAVEEVRKTL